MNESETGMPKPGGIAGNLQTLAEIDLCDIDAPRAIRAQQILGTRATVRLGDIRYLPYPDAEFDLIIDASTLDHVTEQQLPGALDQYCRVLVPGGHAIIMVWATDANKPYVTANAKTQTPFYTCYFCYPILVAEIEDRFEIVERQRFYEDDHGFMTYFLVKKEEK